MHLKDFLDLLQKHALLVSDLNIIAEQIQTVNRQAERFTHDEGPDGSGRYQQINLVADMTTIRKS